MFSNHLLRSTIVVSIIIHFTVLSRFTGFNPFRPAPKSQEIAVRYIKERPLKPRLPGRRATVKKNVFKGKGVKPFLDIDAGIPSAEGAYPPDYPPPLKNIADLKPPLPKAALFSKPAFAGQQVAAFKKKITLPEMGRTRIDNPSYVTYYQIIREKIRRSAYQNYTHNVTGEVFISFVVSSDGSLKDARLVEDKTTVNGYLQNVALRSVSEASPFPRFPKELDYSQLSFNIIISFEIER